MRKKLLIHFGKNLKKERLDKSLSQEQLAEMADLHRTYIGMLERGEKNITILNLKRISKALGITISKLTSDL
ncbi:helix-turn-helix domain-containing protein [Patescibacteria group bacterium]